MKQYSESWTQAKKNHSKSLFERNGLVLTHYKGTKNWTDYKKLIRKTIYGSQKVANKYNPFGAVRQQSQFVPRKFEKTDNIRQLSQKVFTRTEQATSDWKNKHRKLKKV